MSIPASDDRRATSCRDISFVQQRGIHHAKRSGTVVVGILVLSLEFHDERWELKKTTRSSGGRLWKVVVAVKTRAFKYLASQVWTMEPQRAEPRNGDREISMEMKLCDLVLMAVVQVAFWCHLWPKRPLQQTDLTCYICYPFTQAHSIAVITFASPSPLLNQPHIVLGVRYFVHPSPYTVDYGHLLPKNMDLKSEEIQAYYRSEIRSVIL